MVVFDEEGKVTEVEKLNPFCSHSPAPPVRAEVSPP